MPTGRGCRPHRRPQACHPTERRTGCACRDRAAIQRVGEIRNRQQHDLLQTCADSKGHRAEPNISMGVAPTRSQTSLRRPRRSASSRGRNTQLELLIQKFRNILVQDDAAAVAPAATSHFPSGRRGRKRNVVSVIDTKGFRDGEIAMVWVSANPREEDNGGLLEVSERNCCGFAGNAFHFYPKHIGCDVSLTRKWHHRQRRPRSRLLTSSAQSLLEADADEIKGSSFVIALRKLFWIRFFHTAVFFGGRVAHCLIQRASESQQRGDPATAESRPPNCGDMLGDWVGAH